MVGLKLLFKFRNLKPCSPNWLISVILNHIICIISTYVKSVEPSTDGRTGLQKGYFEDIVSLFCYDEKQGIVYSICVGTKRNI